MLASDQEKAHGLFPDLKPIEKSFSIGSYKPITGTIMKRLMHNLIMYHEIQRLKRKRFKPAWIARYLVMDRRTVKKYLTMSEEEYLDFKDKQSVRNKKLDSYEDYVKERLEDFPEATAAQVHDWLKEHHQDFIDVTERTVYNFVLQIRQKHGIPKPFQSRDFAQIEQQPYGHQAQVDFGEYNMSTEEGKRKKVYFFSMVLSRSRQKYVIFREAPFDAMAVVSAHESAFEYFGGIPCELVYDQDKLMLSDENKGDLILTAVFRKYVDYRKFKLHFCRKADPQSKGKIENVIRYVKHNFLYGRKYIDIDVLNSQALAWLERTANAKVHAATKKIPHQEWLIEKQHLEPISEIFSPQKPLKSYKVRKDNTIVCKGNFYQLPIGTYRGEKTEVNVKITDDAITIYDMDGKEIVIYQLHQGKGKLVGRSNFKRDYSSKIDDLILEISGMFTNQYQAADYFETMRRDNPRYIRDQLLMVRKMTKEMGTGIMDAALDFCMQNHILKANDMHYIAQKINVEKHGKKQTPAEPIVIKTLSKSAFKIIPEKSKISDYKKIMN